MSQNNCLTLHQESTFTLTIMSTANKNKARRIVARHTIHGVSTSTAKSLHVANSLGTERAYVQGISNFLNWSDLNDIHPDRRSNINVIKTFLEERSETCELFVYCSYLSERNCGFCKITEVAAQTFTQCVGKARKQPPGPIRYRISITALPAANRSRNEGAILENTSSNVALRQLPRRTQTTCGGMLF